MSTNVAPDPAATPRQGRRLLVMFLLSPVSPASWWALVTVICGLATTITSFVVVTTLFSTGGSLLVVLVGIPVIALGIEAARAFARLERWRMAMVDERPLIAHAYRRVDMNPRSPYGPWLRGWAEAEFLDVNRWLDVAYAVVALPLAMLEFTVAMTLWTLAAGLLLAPVVHAVLSSAAGRPELLFGALDVEPGAVVAGTFIVGLVMLPVAASVTRGLAIMHRAVVDAMLCVDRVDALRRDNERLRDSRSATLELEASELRRIERDIHDGAQQRLVMLAIDLSLAEGKVDSDPAAAKRLIAGARDQARQALAELRDVVRGSAPAILTDRGLTAALSAVAGRSPIPTFVDSTLDPGDRLPASVERAAYYVVSESMTNVAKHAGATRCDVFVRKEPTRLLVEVRDDGKGGAAIAPGGGLAGLRDRVEALDGRFEVLSPAGGPTSVRVILPAPPA